MESLACPSAAQRHGRQLLDVELALHQRVVNRDQSALLEWLQRAGSLVYCAALLRTGAPAEAEAMTEALFLEVWRHPAMFHPADGPLSLQLIRRMSQQLATVT